MRARVDAIRASLRQRQQSRTVHLEVPIHARYCHDWRSALLLAHGVSPPLVAHEPVRAPDRELEASAVAGRDGALDLAHEPGYRQPVRRDDRNYPKGRSTPN